jgi:hypothetical protein
VSIDMPVLETLCDLLVQAQADQNVNDERLLLQSITKLLHNPILYKRLTLDSRTTISTTVLENEHDISDDSFLFPFHKYLVNTVGNLHKHSLEYVVLNNINNEVNINYRIIVH